MKWASAMAVILAVMRTLAKIMGCDQGEKFGDFSDSSGEKFSFFLPDYSNCLGPSERDFPFSILL